MRRDLISKATRNEFRELLVGYTLHEIEMTFDVGGLTPRVDYQPTVSGQRRGLVEAYYANLDFSSPSDVKNLLLVYEEIIENLTQAAERQPRENYEATINGLLRRMGRDGFRYEGRQFVSDGLNVAMVHAPSLIELTEASITELVAKARAKIEAGDHAGAIASAYTLVEGFLKKMLRRLNVDFKDDEGDIRKLYQLAAEPLNLNPKGENLESFLKSILQGLKSQVTGLYEIANKASDRHARRYNPARHHAKLAVNAAFSLCEFLLDSQEYQQQRQERKAAS